MFWSSGCVLFDGMSRRLGLGKAKKRWEVLGDLDKGQRCRRKPDITKGTVRVRKVGTRRMKKKYGILRDGFLNLHESKSVTKQFQRSSFTRILDIF